MTKRTKVHWQYVALEYMQQVERMREEVATSRYSTPPPLNPLTPLFFTQAHYLRSQREMNKVVRELAMRGYPHPNWLPEVLPDHRLLAFVKFINGVGLVHGADIALEIWWFKRTVPEKKWWQFWRV